MQQNYFQDRADLYKSYLLDNVMPFWMEHSPDQEYGGFFTCLDRKGRVFEKDKFMWLQCRQIWTLSKLYQQVKEKQEWLESAVSAAEFLLKHGRDKNGYWYFALDRTGTPLTQPYSIFSDCFAAMAFGQLYSATGENKYAEVAKQTFNNILERRTNPKGIYNKQVPGGRALKSFALPMILCNLVLEIEHLLTDELVHETLSFGVDEVMNVFYKPEKGLILENVLADGSISDTFDGRLINPGHGLEAMWFIMDIATKWKRKDLIDRCVDISLNILDYGWDKTHGGIFYFMDLKGAPLQQLEWDQKLWWVHLEAMICTLKGFKLTGNKKMLDWYEKLHDYTWQHFVDPEYGEMYGYLNRRGEVLLDLKGGKWKGCFHVPRALYQLSLISSGIALKMKQNHPAH